MPLRLFQTSFLAFLAVGALAVPTAAQEVSVQAGTTGVSGDSLSSHYSWQIDYRHHLSHNLAWSIGWLNEGHEAEHHRDGISGQGWYEVPLASEKLSISFGIGAYHYFDTELLPDHTTLNTHGWTPIYSLAATYYTRSPWFLRLTANRINRSNDLETNSVVIGTGYNFGDRRVRPRTASSHPDFDHEITVFLGQSIVNTAESEDAIATALEYRSAISPHVDWSAAWINEGNPEIIRRNGFTTQLWLEDTVLSNRLSISVGLGPYFLFDRKRAPISGQDNPRNIAGLVSPSFAWSVADHWRVRFTWNRVISKYNRDADIFLLGLGYRWGDHD